MTSDPQKRLRHFLMMRRDDGFSLIELLVTILIIGILVSVLIPAFLNQREKGQDTDAKSNATNAFRLVEACYVERQDFQQCETSDILARGEQGGLSWGIDVGQVRSESTDRNQVKVTAVSRSSGEFWVDRTSGVQVRACDGTTAGCSTSRW